MNTVNTEFSVAEVWFTNQIYIIFNFECFTLEIKGNVNLTLIIG